MMVDPPQKLLEKKVEKAIKKQIKNIELISYFKRSTEKSPIFLSEINRKWAEIRPLVNNGLIKDLKPVNSYIFSIDKLENFFYSGYQEKIDQLKNEIWRKRRKKNSLIDASESMMPEEGCEDYDAKLMKVLEFARKTIGDLDEMEMEKEDLNVVVGELQQKQKEDPIYKLLLFIRNDTEIIFNKRTEDDQRVIRKKILNHFINCFHDLGKRFFIELTRGGFYKDYSPAKNYYISDLGLAVDAKLKEIKYFQDETYEKTPEEIAQDEEFNRLKEIFDF